MLRQQLNNPVLTRQTAEGHRSMAVDAPIFFAKGRHQKKKHDVGSFQFGVSIIFPLFAL